ncbi:MAG: phosphodiester glycosidase family protein [Eubacteriales bacterium]
MLKTDKTEEKLQNDFTDSLNSHEYINAYEIYNSEEGKYQQIFEDEMNSYIDELCNESLENLSLENIESLKSAGWEIEKVNVTIEEIKTQIKALEKSSESFQLAIEKYASREFEQAREYFDEVIEADENYSDAKMYLQVLENRKKSWDENEYGRSPYANACASDGEYIYIPYVMNGIDGIFKISYDGVGTDFFPLSDEAGVMTIKSINVVGEYLYFIAGENVGSGYVFESPYCIYEIKKDGTELALAEEGNFTDLFIYYDKVYAASREYGLIEYDRYFDNQKIITNQSVIDLYCNETGVYYTVQHNLKSNSENTLFLYDGNESTVIERRAKLTYSNFGEKYAKTWYIEDEKERLYYYDGEKHIKVDENNIRKVYGFVEGQILYSINGSLGQQAIRAYDPSKDEITHISSYYSVYTPEIKGIFYETDKIIIDDGKYILFSNISGTDIKAVNDVEINLDKLDENKEVIIHIQEEECYTPSGEVIISVISDKQNWIYRDDTLNLFAEKRYLEEYDCNVYVTHIFTKDYSLLTTGNATKDSLSASRSYLAPYISDQYNMVYAQSTDAFYYSINKKQGIIIRQGQLVRDILTDDMIAFFDDGTMQVYRVGDDISGAKLLEMGATSSFSFGPILVEDYRIDFNCVFGEVAGKNPRSAIGYVEPGHYVMVVCDGRAKEVSYGLTMVQLAEVFRDEGCSIAYNLDGGQTTAAMFMGNYITDRPEYRQGSLQHLYRKIAELLYVGTSDMYPIDITEYSQDYEAFKDQYK